MHSISIDGAYLPIKVMCMHCSFILYKGNTPVSLKEIVKKYGNRCPRCLSELSNTPQRIEIIVRRGRREPPKRIVLEMGKKKTTS